MASNYSELNKFDVLFSGAVFNENTSFNQISIHSKKINFRNTKFKNTLEFKVEKQFIEKVEMEETYIYDLKGDYASIGRIIKKDDVSRGLLEGKKQLHNEYIARLKFFRKKLIFINFKSLWYKTINIVKPKYFEYLSKTFTPILGESVKARYPIESRKIEEERRMMQFQNNNPIFSRYFWLASKFGKSFKNMFILSSIVIIFFAWLFSGPEVINFLPDSWQVFFTETIGPAKFKDTAEVFHSDPLNFWSLLYFSIVTFTTLGFGDVVAANTLARILVTIEVICGYIMLGILISSITSILFKKE